jgi:hypothetical protein
LATPTEHALVPGMVLLDWNTDERPLTEQALVILDAPEKVCEGPKLTVEPEPLTAYMMVIDGVDTKVVVQAPHSLRTVAGPMPKNVGVVPPPAVIV